MQAPSSRRPGAARRDGWSAVGALLAALAAQEVGVAGNRWLDQPLYELVPPVVFLVVSVAVVVLVLVPPTAWDFAAGRQAPLRDAGPRQGSGAP